MKTGVIFLNTIIKTLHLAQAYIFWRRYAAKKSALAYLCQRILQKPKAARPHYRHRYANTQGLAAYLRQLRSSIPHLAQSYTPIWRRLTL